MSQDPTSVLYTACNADEFPTDPTCLCTFLFDRCTEWPKLLGLYQGIVSQISYFTNKDYRPEIRAAVAVGGHQLLECITRIYDDFYRESKAAPSFYYQWFQANRTRLEALVEAPPQQGSSVRLLGLQAAKELNGAVGRLVGGPREDGRWPVQVAAPPAAVASRPNGILARPANFKTLPNGAAAAVLVYGFQAAQSCTLAFSGGGRGGAGAGATGPLPAGWRRCPVPALLGVPLAVLPLLPGARRRPHNECLAVFMTVDPVTGFAPNDILLSGLGHVLLARTDGRHFTLEELWELHDYNCRLMNLWPDWESDAARRAALTPEAFRAFTRSRKQDREAEEEEDE